MKQVKKYIIFSICVIIILIISIIIMNIFGKANENIDSREVYNTENIEKIEMSMVKDLSEYATIERLVNIYNSAINQLDANLEAMMVKQQNNTNVENIKKQYRENGIKILEEILYKEYLSSNELEKLSKYSNNKFYIDKMKKSSINNIDIYLIDISYNTNNKSSIIVFRDLTNNTFSILPSEYLAKGNIEESDILEIIKKSNISKIEKNNNNKISEINLNDEKSCLKYYYDYLNMIRTDNIQRLYEILDKNYREKRFENIENFKKYIEENKEELEKAQLSNYQVNDRNGYTEYMCVDKEGRYYIFNASSAMKYTMYLDTYTVDLPEFTEKYENAKDQEKVVLNINKVITAINNQDYKYVYSKLAESFKNNYFNDENSLREFLEKNIYKKNDVKFDNFEREGNVYTYKVRVMKVYEDNETIPEGKNGAYTNLNIVMQLKEGTDFIMSFSIDE